MGKHTTNSGEVFLVDDEFDWMIAQCRWSILNGKQHLTSYVRAYDRVTKRSLLLHRLLLGALPEECIDHANGNGMDNRLCNLRIATRTENQHNRRARRDCASGYKGVGPAPYSKAKPWQVRFTDKGKRYFLGTFKTKEAAAQAYNDKIKELHGEFAKLNVLGE